MSKDRIYITINHLDNYGGTKGFRVNDELFLKKDTDNPFDDEAVAVYNRHNVKCGYVANSVYSVARGTRSAGRIYDRIKDSQECIVRFITEDSLISELL
ncbi:MAG: hypothetical protein IJJ00_08150 [Erysipelotrichaceae bacterium]|nr:hypothetical protein [Erysipelotrichaceae bacterium]